MRLYNVGELALLEKIRNRFGKRGKGLLTGIGDDAAVIAPFKDRLLITSDMMVEGVHFDLSYTTPFQLGYKIVSVNVSDIYAMSGIPEYLLLDLAIKEDMDIGFLRSFFNGINRALKRFNLILVGGDLSSSKEGIAVAVTVTGRAKRPILRSGARPGDKIYVTGNLGDSACGLEILKRINRPVPFEDKRSLSVALKEIKGRLHQMGLRWEIARPLIKKHLFTDVLPRLITKATSMIDISDGLFIDLMRLCDESRVGASIYMNRIPLSVTLKKACSILNLDPYKIATTGGEDYELLFTAPETEKVDAFCIGEITKKGRYLVDERGIERPLRAGGYQHWQ